MDKMKISYNDERQETKEINGSMNVRIESFADISQEEEPGYKDLVSGNFYNEIYKESVMKSIEVSRYEPFQH